MATCGSTLEAALDGLSESRSAEIFGSSPVERDAISTSPPRGELFSGACRSMIEAQESSRVTDDALKLAHQSDVEVNQVRASMLTTTT